MALMKKMIFLYEGHDSHRRCWQTYLNFPDIVGASDKAQPHTQSLQYQHRKRPLQVVAVNQKVQDSGSISFV